MIGILTITITILWNHHATPNLTNYAQNAWALTKYTFPPIIVIVIMLTMTMIINSDHLYLPIILTPVFF